MKGPSSKISKKLKVIEAYGSAETAYMENGTVLSGKYQVSGSTYVVFQDDTKATLKKIKEIRQKILNIKNG